MKIRRIIGSEPFRILILVVWLPFLVGFTLHRQNSRVCVELKAEIKNSDGYQFLTPPDVINTLHEKGQKDLAGKQVRNLQTRAMEKLLVNNPFIKEVQVYHDLKGHILIEVQQVEPLARILVPNERDMYLIKDGKFIPTSTRHTSRVLLIEGKLATRIAKGDTSVLEQKEKLIQLVNYLYFNEFWGSLFPQLTFETENQLVLYPQVGKQRFEFGEIDEIEKKFKKIDAFYKEIIPVKGWDKYLRVSVQYENQIICE